MSKPSD